MNKLKHAEFYGWNSFVKWGKDWGISFEHEDDWKPWWDCWECAYRAGMNKES